MTEREPQPTIETGIGDGFSPARESFREFLMRTNPDWPVEKIEAVLELSENYLALVDDLASQSPKVTRALTSAPLSQGETPSS